MKTVAIIAEYNPFHNGHLYQINYVKQVLNADRIIVIMSGDFVQRGIPALIDKYTRTYLALANGADLVFELPSYFALGSAEYFAQGAVSLVDKLGAVDTLNFGSECGDIQELMNTAKLLTHEDSEYKILLNKYIKQGFSFPSARSMAVNELYNTGNNLLSEPNNILGIEYIKALLLRKSTINATTLQRKGSSYSTAHLETGKHASANAIREVVLKLQTSGNLNNSDFNQLMEYLPASVYTYFMDLIGKNLFFPVFADDFSQLLHYKLLELKNSKTKLSQYYDINENIAHTLINNVNKYTTFSQYALACKSKNLTHTRICRCLIHLVTGMKHETLEALKADDYSQYARLLGFSEAGKDILKIIKANTSIPIITKPSKALKELSGCALESFKSDIFCSEIYQSILHHKQLQSNNNFHTTTLKNQSEFSRQIVKLP